MNTFVNPSSPGFPIVIEDPRPLRSNALKTTTTNLARGTSLSLLDTTGSSGPGNVEMIQIYIAGTGGDPLAGFESYIRIFRDAESTASLFFPLHHLFCCFAQVESNTSPANSVWSTNEIACDYNQSTTNFGGFRKIFIPYDTSIKIQLVNFSATDDMLVDSQVTYRAGPIPAFRTGTRKKRLRQSNPHNYTPSGPFDGFINVNALANQDLINVTGVRGELESLNLIIWNNPLSTSDAPLEGPMNTTIDGTLINQFLGTEDYFYNQVYGVALNVRTDDGGLAYRGPIRDVGGHGSQWFKKYGLQPRGVENFNSSVRINWTNGIAAITSLQVGLLWNVLYYTDH